MMIEKDSLNPTPRDFGEYVFCGAKWLLDKNRSLDSIKMAKYLSYNSVASCEDHNNLIQGQKNEFKCIDWVLKQNLLTYKNIIFNGTGDSFDFIIALNPEHNIQMSCKPDLILSKDNKIMLFEFKAVKKREYLLYPEFDSIHAQIWCYTYLKEMKIDEYYLLRYFIDPTQYSYPIFKRLLNNELDTDKFNNLFKLYIDAINTIKKSGKCNA